MPFPIKKGAKFLEKRLSKEIFFLDSIFSRLSGNPFGCCQFCIFLMMGYVCFLIMKSDYTCIKSKMVTQKIQILN